MINKFTDIFLWLRSRSFFRIIGQTLVMLTPVAIIGAIFQMFSDSFFQPDSLFYNVLNLQGWLPSRVLIVASYASLGLTKATFGVFGIYCAYFSANFTARMYHKDAGIAGVTAIIVLLFISYKYQSGEGNDFNLEMLDFSATLFSIIIGYVVGQIFHWLGPKYRYKRHEHSRDIRQRIFKVVLPIFVSTTIGVIIGISFYLLRIRLTQSSRWITTLLVNTLNTNNVAVSIPLTMFCMLLAWGGFSMPLNSLLAAGGTANGSANLNYALEHNSSWNVPNKYLGDALIKSYGTMGSSGLALAIILIIFMYNHNEEIVTLARSTFIPVIFNSSNALFVGIPVLFNPVYLIPWVIIPGINMLLAGIAIFLHLIPASVYPVLSGTPGPLIAFVATNGAYQTVIFSIFLMIFDIVIFMPFIIIHEKVETRVHQREMIIDEVA